MSTEEATAAPVAEVSPAEKAKQLGNECFAAKNYEEAIKHYTTAIEHGGDNIAVYHSNRSACYISVRNYDAALADGLAAVKADPKFLKGYFRLSSAQIELGQWEDAEATIKASLAVEPGSDMMIRQVKVLKSRKEASKAKKGPRKLDEAQMKEFTELQEQLKGHTRDLRVVQAKLNAAGREGRMNSITSNHLDELSESVPLYRSVGKAFVYTPRADVEARLEKEMGEVTRNTRDLTDRQTFLERRIASVTANIQDLIQG